MSKAGINRSLPNDEYQAAVNANAPSAVNPFLTAGDLPSTTNRSTVVAFAAGMNTFVSANTAGYQEVANFIFAGTNQVGPIIDINFNIYKNILGGRAAQVRIVDKNTGLVVATRGGVDVVDPGFVINAQGIGPINVPATPTVFEVQLGTSSSGGIARIVYLASVEIVY